MRKLSVPRRMKALGALSTRVPALLAVVAAGLAFGPSSASAQSPSILDPASPNSAEISDLYLLIFYIGVGVFLLVEGLILYAVIRFRQKDPNEQPLQVHGNTQVEIAWTITPAIIVLALAAFSHRTLVETFQPPADALSIQVVGNQWWWEFNYPDLDGDTEGGFSTATDLHVPIGQPVVLYLDSSDVIHSFWAPQLAGKTDAIPGERDGGYGQTKVWFVADRPGRFHGHCAEYCGTQHSGMRFTVVAESPEDFAAWHSHMTQAAAAPASDEAVRGLELIQTKGCQGCHAIDGVDTMQGQVGPNLTHVMTRRTLAGGVFDNTTENLAAWIDHPDSMKIGTLMPDLNLAPDEVQAIVAYLETLQ